MREVNVIVKCDNCGHAENEADEETKIHVDFPFNFGSDYVSYIDICSRCQRLVSKELSQLIENAHDSAGESAPRKPKKKRKHPVDTQCSECGYPSSKVGVKMHITKSHYLTEGVHGVPIVK